MYSHSLPVVRGFLMYLTAVILTIVRHYDVFEMKITADEKSWEDEVMMLVLCNGPREGGGFHSGPGAIMDDGILNYTLLGRVSRLMMFRLIPEFMNGTQGRFKPVTMGQMKKIEIKSKQPLYIHTDGETYAGFASNVHHLKVEILPQALEIMVPDKKES